MKTEITEELKLSKKNIELATKAIYNSPRYKIDSELLENFFKENHSHDDLNKVYLKVTILNSFYSTRMGADDCYQMANFIVNYNKNNNLEDAIEKGSIEKIIDFIDCIKTNKNENKKENKIKLHYSFITKYFSNHQRYVNEKDDFPIYDGIVSKMLRFYIKQGWINPKDKDGKIIKVKNDDFKHYDKYKKIVDSAISITEIDFNPTYKELDNFLWFMGKYIKKNKDDSKKAYKELTDLANKN